MKKVLIISYYWPPAGGSGVQRWLKFVKYFRDFDIEPVVYTVDNANYPIIDNTLENDIPPKIEVIKKSIWEPNNLVAFFKGNQSESAGFLNESPSFFGKVSQFIRANYFIPDARKCWIKPSVNYLKKYLTENKIDVIITTGPPHSMHLIGLNLKKELPIKWIVDFRDPWTQIDYFHKLPLTKKAIKKHKNLEKQVLSDADLVVVVGDTMKNDFLKFNTKCITITNGFDSDLEKGEEEILLDSKFTITHVGLMNADRSPTVLWDVLEELIRENEDFRRDFKLQLVGKIDSSVYKIIDKKKLNNYTEIIDYLPHNEVLDYQKKSQVLLLVVNRVPSARGIITGKIFEYLQAKRPILAIAPKYGDLAEIIENSESGITIDFNDFENLKDVILKYYELFKNNSLVVNSKNISQYHRKELTKKMSELITKLVQ